MKRLSNIIIIFSFILIPALASSKALSKKELKQVTGNAGIVFELGEIFIKIKYGDITYTDTDGYGSITKAGIKVSSQDKFSILHFKPIKDPENYSNSKLKNIFGNTIGTIGLTQADIDSNREINKSSNENEKIKINNDFIIPLSNLSIEVSSFCSNLTLINLLNNGLKPSDYTKKHIRNLNLNTGGIVAHLPSVEAEIEGSTKDIIIFASEPKNSAANNNKKLFTIETGTAKFAILGGTIEITPNNTKD